MMQTGAWREVVLQTLGAWRESKVLFNETLSGVNLVCATNCVVLSKAQLETMYGQIKQYALPGSFMPLQNGNLWDATSTLSEQAQWGYHHRGRRRLTPTMYGVWPLSNVSGTVTPTNCGLPTLGKDT
jgi:hypothetical protein